MFAPKEFWCRCGRPQCDAPREPHPELLTRLTTLRTIVGMPVIIDSGNRCAWWNREKKGKPNSEHLTGEAADLRCGNSVDRWLMLQAALQAGFERLGIGATFLHVGVSKGLAPKVIWHYY